MFKYDELNAEKLLIRYKTGVVTVHLSKRQGIRCLSLLNRFDKITHYDRKFHSFFSRLFFLFTGLFEIVRILVFHTKLFEILLFYYKNKPPYETQISSDGKFIFHFNRELKGSQLKEN